MTSELTALDVEDFLLFVEGTSELLFVYGNVLDANELSGDTVVLAFD